MTIKSPLTALEAGTHADWLGFRMICWRHCRSAPQARRTSSGMGMAWRSIAGAREARRGQAGLRESDATSERVVVAGRAPRDKVFGDGGLREFLRAQQVA